MDSGTTPLPKMLMALPVVIRSEIHCDLANVHDEASWRFGRRYLEENENAYHRSFMLARIVSIIALLATSLLVYAFASNLYGPTAGGLAATCTALSPNMIAHGRLATTDIYFTAGMVLSLWAFDLFLRSPNVRRTCLLGVAVGATTLCKFTGLFLFFLLPIALICILVLRRLGIGQHDDDLPIQRRTLYCGFAALGIAILTINAGYFFDGSLSRLDRFEFQTTPFVFVQQLVPGWLPVPLPYYFVQGMDSQLADAEYDSYLMGQFSLNGFWNYYFIAFLVKTPVALQLLVLAAFVCKRAVLHREVPILVVSIGLFAFLSFVGHKNIGLRYLLFLIPFFSIFIGRLTVSSFWTSVQHHWKIKGLAGVCCASLLVSSLLAWPHYLAYFNWPSGGPTRGHEYLLDSNLDWGQDLILLREYMESQRIESVDLAYFGRVPPDVYGIQYRPLIDEPAGRHVVISANLLWGRMYFVGGTSFWPDRDHYRAYRDLKPKAVIGHTLYVFEVKRENMNELTK